MWHMAQAAPERQPSEPVRCLRVMVGHRVCEQPGR